METRHTARVAAPPPVRRRRRAFPIVDARFQLKYTVLVVALGVGVGAVMGALWYRARLDSTRLLQLGGDASLLDEVVRADRYSLFVLVAALLLMAFVLAGWGVTVTHRISGPLHIVARYLSVIAQGYLPDVRPLRKRDELQGFFGAFEEAVKTMRARKKASLRDLDDAISAARTSLEDDGDPRVGLERAVQALEQQRTTIAAGLVAGAELGEEDG